MIEKPDAVHQARAEAQHRLDTQGITVEPEMGGEVIAMRNGEIYDVEDGATPQQLEDIRLVGQPIFDRIEGEIPPGTLHYGGVATPKSLKDMPGSVELLVRLAPKGIEQKALLEFGDPETFGEGATPEFDKQAGVQYRAPHFDNEGANLVVHVRGYIETLPNGEKAFHVFELQSDWAQQQRQLIDELTKKQAKLLSHSSWRFGDTQVFEEQLKELGWVDRGLVGEDLSKDVTQFVNSHAVEFADKFKVGAPSHPILEATNSLGLKAAIQHAKEVGATKVILSDAETAMMTEGHDRVRPGELVPLNENNVTLAKELELKGLQNLRENLSREELSNFPRPTVMQLARGENVGLGLEPQQADVLRKLGFELEKVPISQEKGMRLNYDQVLPSAMEKLTGDKGQDVDLGTT